MDELLKKYGSDMKAFSRSEKVRDDDDSPGAMGRTDTEGILQRRGRYLHVGRDDGRKTALGPHPVGDFFD